MYWSAGLVADVPRAVVTVTSTVPLPGGATAVIELRPLSRKEVAGIAPKSTAVTLSKLVPVTVTWVPPPVGPPAGSAMVVSPVTVGEAT